MIIGIDYRLAVSTNRGMGRYCREIVRQLVNMNTTDQHVLYVDRPTTDVFPENVTIRQIPTQNFILGEQVYLPRFAKSDRVDVLWSPHNTFPLFLSRKIKLVVTIHDLIFWNRPQGKSNFAQMIGRIYRKYCLLFGKRRIHKCFTVSEFSRKDIVSKLGIKEVLITPNCIDFFAKKISQWHGEDTDFEQPFYFTLSGDAPSKNLPFVIAHFKEFLQNERLLIAGVPKTSKLRNFGNDNIVFLEDNLSDEQLITYYKKCKIFLFLSLQEGFGIPLLEALICGAKIVASNRTSIPEIAGEFAVLTDPENHKELSKAIKEADDLFIDEDKLKLHLKKYLSWELTAQTVSKIFRSYEK